METILTDKTFEDEVIKSSMPVLIDFWAEWCGPCKVLSPIVDELANEYAGKAIKIAKINVDENSQTASKFGIMSIPTLLFFKNGKVVEQLVGVQSRDDLKNKIEKLIS